MLRDQICGYEIKGSIPESAVGGIDFMVPYFAKGDFGISWDTRLNYKISCGSRSNFGVSCAKKSDFVTSPTTGSNFELLAFHYELPRQRTSWVWPNYFSKLFSPSSKSFSSSLFEIRF